MKIRRFYKDSNHVLRELNRLKPFGLNVDMDSLIAHFQKTELSRYEALKEIVLKAVSQRKDDNEFLIEAYYLLYSRAFQNNDPDHVDYYRKHAFQSAIRKVENLSGVHRDHKLLITGNGCENCHHLTNKYIDLDIGYEDFPIPIKDCK